MADNTQIVDHILKQEGQGTYSVYFKDLTDTDKQSIQAWLKDNIQYNDVQGAPALPGDNKAYDENNNIKPFDKLAFTADYDDLNNAPTIPDIGGERPTAFNPIAFTGVVNLDNVAVSNVINLNEYSINSNDAEHIAGMTANDISNNNTKLQNIGSSDNFVKGLNAFQRNGNGILLFNTLQSKIISGGFLITKTPTYLVSNSGIYFLTDVKNTTWDGPTLQYFELHLVAVTDSNYTTIRTYETNITDEAAEEILENIELTAKNVILIFDFSNNILYCKTKEIGREQEQGILEETDPIFAVSPAANITNEDITNWNNKSDFDETTLAAIATTGNYNDLLNKYYVFSLSDFIYKYDDINNTWTTLTGNELTTIQQCGLIQTNTDFNAYVKNIHYLYSTNDNTDNNNIITSLLQLITQFNNKKRCYLKSTSIYQLITNIETNYSNNQLNNVIISCVPRVINNFNDMFVNTEIQNDEDIQDIINNTVFGIFTSTIIVDLKHDILYSYYQPMLT